MISKNKCYEIAKEFCDLEDDYLMGIVLNKNKELEIKTLIPDNEDIILYEWNTYRYKSRPNKKELANLLYSRIKVEVSEYE